MDTNPVSEDVSTQSVNPTTIPEPETKPDWLNPPQAQTAPIPGTLPTPLTHEVPKKNKAPMLFLVLIPIFIALGAFGVLAYQKYFAAKPVATTSPTPATTPDPTADWKTYESTDYGFSFKYPYLGYSICPETAFFSIFQEKDLNCDGIVYEVPLISFRNWWTTDLSKETPVSNRIIVVDGIQINIDRYQSVGTSYGASTTNIIEIATIPLNDKNVQIYAFGEASVFQKSEDLLDQILSTFKFTESESSNETSTTPQDLVNLVKQTAAAEAKTTVSNIIIGQTKVEGNFAQVAYNISGEGGAVYWAAKVGGVWKIVTGGQEIPSCSILSPYNFPADFSCN
jgi:hypothetical protein